LHRSCGAIEKVWLPVEFRDRVIGLKPHPYCLDCGVVKNISPDRARKLGFYINVLAGIARFHRISEAQVRLIVRDLQAIEDFEDSYSLSAAAQEKIFIAIVKKYCNFSEGMIRSFLKLS
jgi:hypothetical protein